MKPCCETQSVKQPVTKMACPECRTKQKLVSYQTLLHQLSKPCTKQLNPEAVYYFCRNHGCSTVYFDVDGFVFTQKDMRWPIGQKMTSPSRPICYCFDVSYNQVADEFKELGTSPTKDFVIAQTKSKKCACEIRNPSGACCLVDFPKR